MERERRKRWIKRGNLRNIRIENLGLYQERGSEKEKEKRRERKRKWERKNQRRINKVGCFISPTKEVDGIPPLKEGDEGEEISTVKEGD